MALGRDREDGSILRDKGSILSFHRVAPDRVKAVDDQSNTLVERVVPAGTLLGLEVVLKIQNMLRERLNLSLMRLRRL
jgi:hypothetical protein